jgi:hypothetical protein
MGAVSDATHRPLGPLFDCFLPDFAEIIYANGRRIIEIMIYVREFIPERGLIHLVCVLRQDVPMALLRCAETRKCFAFEG